MPSVHAQQQIGSISDHHSWLEERLAAVLHTTIGTTPTIQRTVKMATAGAEWMRANVANNGLAVLTLDRPKALNAMNLDMDIIYKKYLDEWASQSNVKCVLVEGSTSRAFCAGMDIKGVAAALGDKSTTLPHQVFRAEYSLICEIARYKKPYISLMDGITMGFGIGLSGHGRYRVVTERTVLAMPENGIGLFPDVGFAHLAAKSPGNGAVGAYLALTGTRISNPADALYVGLGTHYIPSEKLTAFKEELVHSDLSNTQHEKVEELLLKYCKNPESDSKLETLLPSITSCFGNGKSVAEIFEALKRESLSSTSAVAEWASGALAGLYKGAPFSLFVTQKHYAAVAAAISIPNHPLSQIENVMKSEYFLGVNTSMRPDFLEGVRAVLIDKDQTPHWQPSTIEGVDLKEINETFTPVPETFSLD